jgi:AcrR family transcriptional regulator
MADEPRDAIGVPKNARSTRTRRLLLTTARELLENEGFEALTVTNVARQAGVTRRAVYLHFSSRTHIVNALYDHVADTEGLADSLGRVWAAPDSVAALEEWARHFGRYHSRVLAVDRAVQQFYKSDPDAARHREKVIIGKHKGCRRIFEWLHDEGRLDPQWTVTTATEMLMALTTSDVIEHLTIEAGWPQEKFAEHVATLLRATFVSEA